MRRICIPPSAVNTSSEFGVFYAKKVAKPKTSAMVWVFNRIWPPNSIQSREIQWNSGCFDGKARRPSWGGGWKIEKHRAGGSKAGETARTIALLAGSPPAQGRRCISNLFVEAYMSDPLPGKRMEAIRTNGGLQEITVAECIVADGQIPCRGNLYVLESDAMHLQTIQAYLDRGFVGHPGQAKTFDLLDRQH